jgi:NAD(P)-dependent dehydrogenase (short-subunit alcohol dehydrogenase family)
MNIKGKTALITGGSLGLGRALAITLAGLGARVVIVGRHKETLDEVVGKIRGAHGEAYGILADVGNKEDIYSITGQAAALTNAPIDILINNASTLGPVPLKLFLDTECEEMEQTFQVNTIGAFRLIKAVAGSMILRKTGVIINISSDAAVSAYPTWGVYSIAKAALDHLTRIFAAETENTGLRIVSIDPGEMNTKMHTDAMPEANPNELQNPFDVAKKITDVITHIEKVENGARLIAPQWEVPYEARKIAKV